MRRNAKVDTNHAQIVSALEAAGWRVLSLAVLGRGIPDLLAWKPSTGAWRLVEVKQPTGKVNARQQAFAAHWPVSVIRSIDQVKDL